MNINKLKKEVHELLIKTDKYKCPEYGSGIHADTSKLLIDIISQLVFALKAWERLDKGNVYKQVYKEAYENHVTHAFILLLDFAEYEKINIRNETLPYSVIEDSIHDNIYTLIEYLQEGSISYMCSFISTLCKQQNIDIEKHIAARLEYMRWEV